MFLGNLFHFYTSRGAPLIPQPMPQSPQEPDVILAPHVLLMIITIFFFFFFFF